MIFSTLFWPFTLFWAFISASTAAGLAFAGGNRETGDEWRRNKRTVKAGSSATSAALLAFPVALLAVRFLMYYVQPSFQGSFFGYWPVLLCTMIPAAVAGLICGGHASRKSITAVVLGAAALLFVPLIQYGFNAWGSSNAGKHADLPKIRIAGADEKIPPTDPNHMVKVTKSIAIFKGQTALSTESGVASRFTVNKESYTLQFVNGHRYWIAPLTPVNNGDTFWTPLMGGRATSPGYVVVDAENPGKDAWLKTGYQISLFTDQSWSMSLKRWIYQQGYNDGYLEEPIFEVDDNWVPYYTVTYVRNAFGGVSGKQLHKVLVVKVEKEEPTLEVFDVKEEPKWVDRVVSRDLVKEWATDWGLYGGDYARNNFWHVCFGINRTGTMKPADFELAYTTDAHNVWVIPMTSTHDNDHTVIGVLVYESGKNEGTFYPGIKGFNEPSSVDETMVNARDNIKHYNVESVQLYSIYGELTWVAIYASPQSIGKSFGGIGILHAHSQDAAAVISANDMQTALRLDATQLAPRNQGGGEISRTVQASREVHGKVQRI
ncbi:MAG: hypothetical protein K2X27_11940, partial [Candidatus Obscuribacterales bacterium]|nr:hypothetical protein [Candidatus Obscuribacterales bacterium]